MAARTSSRIALSLLSPQWADVGRHGHERANEVGAAHDADDFSVAHDRHALDTLAFEQLRDIGDRTCFSHRRDVGSHHVPDLPRVLLDILAREFTSWTQQARATTSAV